MIDAATRKARYEEILVDADLNINCSIYASKIARARRVSQ